MTQGADEDDSDFEDRLLREAERVDAKISHLRQSLPASNSGSRIPSPDSGSDAFDFFDEMREKLAHIPGHKPEEVDAGESFSKNFV